MTRNNDSKGHEVLMEDWALPRNATIYEFGPLEFGRVCGKKLCRKGHEVLRGVKAQRLQRWCGCTKAFNESARTDKIESADITHIVGRL